MPFVTNIFFLNSQNPDVYLEYTFCANGFMPIVVNIGVLMSKGCVMRGMRPTVRPGAGADVAGTLYFITALCYVIRHLDVTRHCVTLVMR